MSQGRIAVEDEEPNPRDYLTPELIDRKLAQPQLKLLHVEAKTEEGSTISSDSSVEDEMGEFTQYMSVK